MFRGKKKSKPATEQSKEESEEKLPVPAVEEKSDPEVVAVELQPESEALSPPDQPELTLLERCLAECPEWLRHYFITGKSPTLGAVEASRDYNELRHSTGAMHVLWAKHGEKIVKESGRQCVWASEAYRG